VFGFLHDANLDEGTMWPTAFALKELTAAEEARIGALVKKAASWGGLPHDDKRSASWCICTHHPFGWSGIRLRGLDERAHAWEDSQPTPGVAKQG
jgi:hypothetical protein